jgi:hypothetical protein
MNDGTEATAIHYGLHIRHLMEFKLFGKRRREISKLSESSDKKNVTLFEI